MTAAAVAAAVVAADAGDADLAAIDRGCSGPVDAPEHLDLG